MAGLMGYIPCPDEKGTSQAQLCSASVTFLAPMKRGLKGHTNWSTLHPVAISRYIPCPDEKGTESLSFKRYLIHQW